MLRAGCHQGNTPVGNKVALAQSPGTDSCGLSVKAKKGVGWQRNKKLMKGRSWTVGCLAIFTRGSWCGSACTGSPGNLLSCSDPCPPTTPALGAAVTAPSCHCHLWLCGDSTVWQTPASQPLAVPSAPWVQERQERVHLLSLCTSVTLWHSVAVLLIFRFSADSWLFASPNEELDVFSSFCLRDTATFVSTGACQVKHVSVN